MIYEACFDSRRGSGMDVNCFFLSRSLEMEQRWKLEIEVGDRIYLMAGLFTFLLGVWVWSCTHQMSELRVGYLFLVGIG